MPDTGSEAIQGARGEAEVAAALVCFGAVPPYQACNLEGAQVVGEQVGGDVEQALQLDRGPIGARELVDDGQASRIAEGGVATGPRRQRIHEATV